jgi:hypothetical protein
MTNVRKAVDGMTKRMASGELIANCYKSLRTELGCIPMRCPAYKRIFCALAKLEQRADHRRVHVERNAEPLPLDLSWEAPW